MPKEGVHKRASSVLLILLVTLIGALLFYSSGRPRPHSVTLNWHPPMPEKGIKVVGYNIYRSTKPGGPYMKIATGVRDPTYKDNNVSSKTAYYYVVTALSDSGRESRYSNEVTANIP
jgi:fibronectin type 3 domain-containing protein